MAAAHLPVMQTTPTTATIALSGKRVRNALRPTLPVSNASSVCVSDALVAEIKRIVKDSEILKYVSSNESAHNHLLISPPEKMTQSGLKRTKMVVKSWKFG